MTTWVQAQGRMLRSARALKAFFEHKLRTSFEILSEAPPVRGEGDVQFNATISQYGWWGLRAPKALNQEDQAEIRQTFDAILGGFDRLDQQRDDLQRFEGKLTQTLDEIPSNVIPLHRSSRPAPGPSANDRRWILKLDCLIESAHVSEIHKMAMELHSHSARYAFLEYRDLAVDRRSSVPELLSLGAVSLFIPDLLQLSLSEQNSLKDLMSVETIQRPLLMVGTNIPYAELRRTPGVHIEFLVSLSRAYIKLSRPFREYKDQGLIHYFLDSLSENPT